MATFMIISPSLIGDTELSKLIDNCSKTWIDSHNHEDRFINSSIEEAVAINAGPPDTEYVAEELEDIAVHLNAPPRSVLWIDIGYELGSMELASFFSKFFIERCHGIIDSNGLIEIEGDWVRKDDV